MKISLTAAAFSIAAAVVVAGCGSAAQLSGPASSAPSTQAPQPVSASPGALASPPSGWGARPDKNVTPGAAGSSIAAICPNLSPAMKNLRGSATLKDLEDKVYAEYGIATGEHGLYTIDHLVPLELDGSNSIRNLWPQPVEGSQAKNRLEDTLHRMVCGGQISLRSAQNAIAGDWVHAYHRYVAPAATHTPSTPTPAPPPPQTAPPAPAPPSSAPSPTGCYPLTNAGNCYEPGEFCRTSDHGVTGRAGDGEMIRCEDNNGWRWEPV